MDTLVGVALILIVFVALLGLLRASVLVSSSAKAKAGATAVATTQLEYVRSLPYDSVGTVGGIPAGPLPQYATTTLNGIPYAVRTLVQYVDDPADGAAGADTNGITSDYKRVRIATTYTFRGETREVAMVSNVAPPSLETTTGGGTLRVAVVDATGAPLSGASVRIENPSRSPAVDFTTFSDLSGTVLLPGAPTSTDYRITVSKSGYSSARTYARDSVNQNPTPGYLTVAGNQTTSATFAIDELATLVLRTLSPIASSTYADSFDNAGKLQQQTGTAVAGGALALAGTPGAYVASGSARATTTRPTYLAQWTALDAEGTAPAGTAFSVTLADAAGVPVPETDLPGNAAGFTAFPVDLSGLSTTTYPALSLTATLSTASPLSTPQLSEWSLAYDEGPLPLPNVPFVLTGTKLQGTGGAGQPIYKTVVSTTTGATGVATLSLEWDAYDLALPNHAVLVASTTPPYALAPGTVTEEPLILE